MDVFPRIIDLGRVGYQEAYRLQLAHLEEVLAARAPGDSSAQGGGPGARAEGGDPGRVLLLEHDPPVITLTKRPAAASNLVATAQMLERAGVTVAETDRGGDITYHGPGQLVAYAILDLNYYTLGLHDYMRLLESAVIQTCAAFGVQTERDAKATGVWVPRGDGDSAKICAMGVRVRRWVSMHGLALNVTTDLEHFKLIVPCGLAGRPVTSLRAELGAACPTMEEVKRVLSDSLSGLLNEARARAVKKSASRP